ncbi:MAG: hypothetical protein EBZ59_04255 [Planctomycetia bacterium]|nr:hypothetical protein [Planctomycetia bacterium]
MSRSAILVATDFSPAAAAAVAHAARLAVQDRARLHVLHVLPDHRHAPAAAADERRRCLERIAQAIDPETELALDTVKELRHGVAEDAITAYAREQNIDLIVMGRHGRTGLGRLALGSVSQRVLRHAPCPVVVVPAGVAETTPPTDVPFVPAPPFAADSPAIDLVERAAALGATDVHVDPVSDGDYSVRLRIDGQLAEYCRLDGDVAVHLINRLKTLAELDIATPFRPREGRLRLPPGMGDVEVRITTAPVAGGEAVSLRLLVRDRVFLPLEHLGLMSTDLDAIQSMIRSVEGLVVVTGPTGSGKTTTVYSMLESLASVERNIVSIEDPVELAVPSIRQMSVDEKHGITIAGGLRTLLRMDPDVIFVGEVRDPETAAVATHAANSGHYVLSTMHARSVSGTVTALADLGVDRRSLAGTLAGVINQRLVRRLCTKCRVEAPLDARRRDEFVQAGVEPPRAVYEPGGCPGCRQSGYRGRIGLFEVARATAGIRDAIASGADERRLQEAVVASGVRTLLADALAKIGAGIVDYEEAMRVHWLR